ncbi:HEAT repeat domain-containing protein [Plantibacter sp. ME-Dv--P-095]|uniref:HEAT repeat domain-containing protein n=1 Tax=Plantibacter sp. ME-Dv--P-095 TaxID=3040299 RepID=UPI00254FE1C9|nr:HEAT repeat domain-containing protein [Plantibacter sp. ME-Dv--P-095]
MSSEYDDAAANGLARALRVPASSDRLQAALAAGTTPKPSYIEVLVDRCAVEPDFFVRDMLTWALVRHDPEVTVPRLVEELGSVFPQARSQALHTLSKTGDPRTWSAITLALLEDDEDQVARAAWRTAAGVVPEREAPALSELLARQFGRGDRDVRLSLTRAFLSIGELGRDAAEAATTDTTPEPARSHARATVRMLDDPELDFDEALATSH